MFAARFSVLSGFKESKFQGLAYIAVVTKKEMSSLLGTGAYCRDCELRFQPSLSCQVPEHSCLQGQVNVNRNEDMWICKPWLYMAKYSKTYQFSCLSSLHFLLR